MAAAPRYFPAVGALVGLPFSRSGWAGASLFVGALVVLAALIAAWLVAVTRRTQAAATPGGS